MEIYSRVMRGVELFHMKNLPNFELISCHISVVAGTVVVALRHREVGHWNYSLSAVVADKRCLMPVRCNCEKVGQHVLGSGIDFVGAGFGRAGLGAGEFFVLQLRPRQRFFREVQFVCC